MTPIPAPGADITLFLGVQYRFTSQGDPMATARCSFRISIVHSHHSHHSHCHRYGCFRRKRFVSSRCVILIPHSVSLSRETVSFSRIRDAMRIALAIDFNRLIVASRARLFVRATNTREVATKLSSRRPIIA